MRFQQQPAMLDYYFFHVRTQGVEAIHHSAHKTAGLFRRDIAIENRG